MPQNLVCNLHYQIQHYIILRLWEICKSFFQILILLLYPKTASKAQPSVNEIILICGLRARFGSVQTAATKVTNKDYFIHRGRLFCLRQIRI